MSKNPQGSSPHAASPAADGCPTWANDVIAQILELEIRLGNVRPSGTDWQQTKLTDLNSRLDEETAHFDESVVEASFRRLSARLLTEGFTAAQAAAFVNSRIPSGRLPYCNAGEVEEAAREAGLTDV